MGKRKITLAQVATVCRVILGLVFIVSGFIKTIDPWGTAIKMTEYFDFLHIGWLDGWRVGLAIWLCAAELMMGCMLLFKVRTRLISIFALLTMSIFLVLTLVVAIVNPFDSCGCMGEAVHIDNWMSFFKNLVLWPMTFIVWYSHRGQRIMNFSHKEIVLTIVFATMAGTIGTLSWRHLPAVDMYPYKVGTDLRSDVLCTRCIDRTMKLLYLDNETGEEHLFEMSDTTWYDHHRWEYIRTVTPYDDNPPAILDYDFAMWRGGLNYADDIVYDEGETIMIVIRDTERKLPSGCEKKLVPYVNRLVAEEANVIAVIGTPVDNRAHYNTPEYMEIGGVELPCYGMERELLQVMLRADVGAVTIRDGVIASKKSCWNLK